MNATHVKPVEEIRMTRREYLREVTETRLLTVVGGMIALSCGVLALFVIYNSLFLRVITNEVITNDGFDFDGGQFDFRFERYHEPATPSAPLWVTALGLGAVSGFGVWLCRFSFRESRSLPYVPPIIGKTADLPADMFLLRASVQPVASNEELLRPARHNEPTSADELLRPESELRNVGQSTEDD